MYVYVVNRKQLDVSLRVRRSPIRCANEHIVERHPYTTLPFSWFPSFDHGPFRAKRACAPRSFVDSSVRVYALITLADQQVRQMNTKYQTVELCVYLLTCELVFIRGALEEARRACEFLKRYAYSSGAGRSCCYTWLGVFRAWVDR